MRFSHSRAAHESAFIFLQVIVLDGDDDEDDEREQKERPLSFSWAAMVERGPAVVKPECCTPSVNAGKSTSSSLPPSLPSTQGSTKITPVQAPIQFKPTKRPDKATLDAMGPGTMWGYIESNKSAADTAPSQPAEAITVSNKRPVSNPAPVTADGKAGKSKKAKHVTEVEQDENDQPQQKVLPASKPNKVVEVDPAAAMRAKAQEALTRSVQRKTWERRALCTS